jgi:hypothetical protein
MAGRKPSELKNHNFPSSVFHCNPLEFDPQNLYDGAPLISCYVGHRLVTTPRCEKPPRHYQNDFSVIPVQGYALVLSNRTAKGMEFFFSYFFHCTCCFQIVKGTP